MMGKIQDILRIKQLMLLKEDREEKSPADLLWDFINNEEDVDGGLISSRYTDYEKDGYFYFYFDGIKEYYEFFSKGKAEEKLNQYQIDLVLLQKSKIISYNWFEKYFLGFEDIKAGEIKDYLLDYLVQSNSWKKVYEDDISLIFLR